MLIMVQTIMKYNTKIILYWTPRVFTLFFALFISIFALDVFSSGYPIWKIPIALFMHLIPSIIILIILAVSWKWEWVGGIVYMGLAVYSILGMWRGKGASFLFLISAPLFILGILFLLGWFYRKEISTYKKDLFSGSGKSIQ